jgi:hypothetical protein
MRRRKDFGMETIWKFAPRISWALLVLPAALFAFLGLKYFGDPIGTTAADSISLAPTAGITDMRVVGSIFLACSLITVFSLVSRDRVLSGLRFVLTIVGAVTLARLYGAIVDGAPRSTVTKLRTELVLLAIFGVGLALEILRHRRNGTGVGIHRSSAQSAMETRR